MRIYCAVITRWSKQRSIFHPYKLVIPSSWAELVPETKIREPPFPVWLETTWTMRLKLDATPPPTRQTTSIWYANTGRERVFVGVLTWVELCTIQRGVIGGWSREKNKVRDRILPRGPGCGLDENGRKGTAPPPPRRCLRHESKKALLTQSIPLLLTPLPNVRESLTI